MSSSSKKEFTAISLVITILFVTAISADNSTCGALISQNQYTEVLKTAPSCFKNGCGGTNLTSMSTTCASKSPCFPIWDILHREWQQDWCSNCSEHDKRACRLRGWAVLNATAACDISPNTWMFTNGGCCTDGGDEMASLSSWIETICNSSYINLFTKYDNMALVDWDQYILPVNHTVAPDNTATPNCPNRSLSLALFGIENLVFLIFVLIYFFMTLYYERGFVRRIPFVMGLHRLLTPIRWIKSGLKLTFMWIFRIKPSEDGTADVTETILLAIFLAGVQVAFNFASAVVVQRTPGYSHVNVPLLALLFCSRPRLGWLACLLSAIPDRVLINRLHMTDLASLVSGQTIVARVAVSSAMGEVIMQLCGSYFLGKTAHVGVIREFYQHNHLSPFEKGMQARNMYGGAMLWVVAAFFVVTMWIIVVIWHSLIMQFFTVTASWMKQAATLPRKRSKRGKIPKRLRSHRNDPQEQTGLFPPHSAGGPIMRGGSGVPDQDSDASGGIFRPATNTPSAPSSISAGEGAIIRPQDFRRMAQVPTSPQNRTQVDYEAVSQDAIHRPEDFPVVPDHLRARFTSPTDPVHRPEDFDIGIRQPHASVDAHEDPFADSGHIYRGPNQSQFPQNTGYQGVGDQEEDDEDAQEDEKARSFRWNTQTHVPSDFREWQPFILGLGVFLGILSYIAQWLFWSGFVNTSGDKFCPPKLGTMGTLWTIAGILGISTAFGVSS